jgi:hypothetical protein
MSNLEFIFLQAKLRSWKAQALWAKFDKRASHKCYNRGKACPNTRVSIHFKLTMLSTNLHFILVDFVLPVINTYISDLYYRHLSKFIAIAWFVVTWKLTQFLLNL